LDTNINLNGNPNHITQLGTTLTSHL